MKSLLSLVYREDQAPLKDAMKRGDVEGVKKLIENQADVNSTNECISDVLHYAILEYNNLEKTKADKSEKEKLMQCIEILLTAKNLKIDIENSRGKTPLTIAADLNLPEIIRALLKAGANDKIKDSCGRTALDYCKAKQHEDCANILTAWSNTANSAAMINHTYNNDKSDFIDLELGLGLGLEEARKTTILAR